MLSTRRFTVSDVSNNRFYQLPKFLFEGELHETLNNDAKILYSLLKDRHSLSVEHNWINERGEVFFVYTRTEMDKMLGCTSKTTRKAINQLKEVGLLEEEHLGLNKANRLYLMALNAETTGEGNFPTPERENFPVQNGNNSQSGTGKNTTQDGEIIPFSKTDINKTDLSKTNSSNTERERLRLRSRKIETEDMPKDEGDDNPKMTSQIRERIRWLSQNKDVIPLTPREREMFDLFISERKRRGKTTSCVQRNTLIQNLYLCGHDEYKRLEILEKTIAKGWNDIYPLDRGAPGATDQQEEGYTNGNGSI